MRMFHSRFGRVFVAGLLLVLAQGTGNGPVAVHLITPAFAQLPPLMPAKPSSPTPQAIAPAFDPVKDLADAQKRLNESRDAMARIQAQLNRPGLSAPTRNEALKQFNLRQTLADRYAQQVDYLKQLQVLEQTINDARQQLAAWTPPAGSPPWPITVGDKLRSEMQGLQTQVKQLTTESTLLSDQLVLLGRQKNDADVQLRQMQEKLGITDPANETRLDEAARMTLNTKRAESALRSAILLRSDLERRVKDKQLELAEVKLATLSKTWAYYDGKFALTPDILSAAKAELQSLIDRDRDFELKALNQSELAVARLAKAQSEFDALNPEKTPADRLKRARAALDIAQANEVKTRSEVDRLRQIIELGGYGLQAWDARAQIYQTPRPDAAVLATITERIKIGLVRVEQARDSLQKMLNSREQEAFDLRLASLTAPDALDRQVMSAKLQAANAQSDDARTVLGSLDKFDQFLRLILDELGVSDARQSWSERLLGYGQRAISLGRTVWQYELFTVDDVIIADGKEVKTTRSVTIGKSIGAIAILIFGFLMVSWLIRSSIGLAERRIGLKPSAATLIRRWLTVIATGTLIVLSFNLVQIPLSVFAFLGGALAIGIGFGTQNLLKNLMSGVMLLVERPIRIGDLVEIDGVRGRVTSIGIRFSTLHGADGIDTLIPNSELVEKKLTNWTYASPDVRREIKVGVAYGSDPVQVKNLLQAAAREHPNVIQKPEPMVVLDDLADSALLFTLRFWIRLDQGLDAREIDSDLRCEILQKLAGAGIDVPFPQRDVHLIADTPVPVRVSP